MKKDAFISEMRASYQHKFAKKPEVIDGNMQALELTYEELKDVYAVKAFIEQSIKTKQEFADL